MKCEANCCKRSGPNFNITTWAEENSAILGALLVEKNVMFYLLFFIVLVAALCILSAQITFVVQKTREIGMLKALGATNLQISGFFFFKAPSSASSAWRRGFGLGILAVTYRNEFLAFYAPTRPAGNFSRHPFMDSANCRHMITPRISPSFADVRLSFAFSAACCPRFAPDD